MTTIRQAMQQAQKSLCRDDRPRSSDARFDALCLAEKAFGLSKTQLRLNVEQQVDPAGYFELVARRGAGEPLQYILGEWEFYGLRFAVGPGVLIPRPETEMLVELALERKPATVLDLCAGSGCVGLSVAHHCPEAQVHLVELSDQAMPYLRKNAASYPNATIHQADIFHCQLSIVNCSLILANPPYVPTAEIPRLSREVRQEPALALDGGADGLAFYREIAQTWLPRLKPGGMLAVECGEGQAEQIAELLGGHTEILRDFNAIGRVVTAYYRESG